MSDRYDGSFASTFTKGVWDNQDSKFVPSKIDTKAKAPTYRHAQKESMKYGDSGTYFMRKSGRKSSGKRGGKR